MLNSVSVVLRSLPAHLMQVELLLVTYIWLVDCTQFLSIWTDVKFLDGLVLKNRIRTEFRFSAHPYKLYCK